MRAVFLFPRCLTRWFVNLSAWRAGQPARAPRSRLLGLERLERRDTPVIVEFTLTAAPPPVR